MPLELKREEHLRLWGTNLNGLKYDDSGGKLNEILGLMKETTPDIVALTEHNTDTTQYRINHNIYHLCKEKLETPTVTSSSTPISSHTAWKPGGTMLIANGPVTSRMIAKDVDYLGRWSLQTFEGKKGIKVTIINCYNIPKYDPKKGKFTNQAQQEAYLRSINKPHNNIRQLFFTDLSNLITSLEKKGHDLLILGDFNKALSDVNSGMARLLSKHKLHDLMRHSVGQSNFATYARGSKRIDFALGSDRLLLSLVNAGYEEFGARVRTDHRPFFLDFDLKKLFGIAYLYDEKNRERWLFSNDRVKVTEYISTMYNQLCQWRVFEKMEDLLAADSPDHDAIELLDQQYKELALKTEYDQRRRHIHEWSTALLKKRSHVSYLQYHLSQYRTNISHHKSLDYLQSKHGPFEVPTTLKECEKWLSEAQLELNKLIKDCVVTREMELKEKIKELEIQAEEASEKKAKDLKLILRAEQLKNLYRKLQYLRKTKSGTLYKLEIPLDPNDNPKAIAKDETKWQVLELEEEIQDALMQRNQKHFGQAENEGTTFFTEPLKSDINYTATSAAAEAIIEGEYDVSKVDALTGEFIKTMQKQNARQTPDSLSVDQVSGRLKVWREQTTTSPSGLHLGHYKSLIAKHEHSGKKEEDPDRALYDMMQLKLLQFRTNLINYCLKWGYNLKRWTYIVNRILMKDPANFKIHRVRIIHLYEADYSMTLAIAWRDSLHMAEDEGALNSGAYGSRPNRTAHTPVFLEELMMEVSRLTRKHLILFDHDATSCYDRIVASIMSMVSSSFGTNKKVLVVWAKTLEEAEFHLKIGKKETTEFYKHCKAFPIHGAGQGATNAPCGWLFICSRLFDVYDDHASGAEFTSPDKSFTITIKMIGFVDDTKSQHNRFRDHPQPPVAALLDTMSQEAQIWHDLLWRSGGAMELPKCSYYAATWDFNQKGFPFLSGGKPEHSLELVGSDQEKVTIEGLSSYSSHKTLGYFKTPNGSSDPQYKALLAKSKQHAEFLQSSYLSPRETYIYYSGMYLPSICYPLAASYLTKTQLKAVERKPLNSILSKTGMCSKTHRSVVFGPRNLGGKAFRSLVYEQGLLQLKLLITESRRGTDASELLFIGLQWAQYASGLGTPLLEMKEVMYHSESKWIKSLQEFLVAHGIAIKYYRSYLMPLQRKEDQYLLDIAIESGLYTSRDLHEVNHVRLYLNVLTVADIADEAGRKLNDSDLRMHSVSRRYTRYIPVNQAKPPVRSWNLWKKLLTLVANPNGDLKQPLGDWVVEKQDFRMQWSCLYSRESMQYYTYNTENHNDEHYDTFLSSLPSDVTPVKNINTVPCAYPRLILSSSRSSVFREYLQDLDMWESELFQEYRLTPGTTLEFVIQVLQQQQLVLASDGSVVNETGTFGWVLADKSNGNRLVENSGWSRGVKPSSYRAEIFGALSGNRFLLHLCRFFNCTIEYRPEWHCDNEALVDKYCATSDALIDTTDFSEDDWHDDALIPAVMQADWDVLQSLIVTKNQLPLDAKWVKSHQDAKSDKDDLTLEAQLNCRADQLAGQQQRKRRPQDISTVHPIPFVATQLSLQTGTITSRHIQTLRQHITSAPLLEHMKLKNQWSQETTQEIDWSLQSKVVSKHSSSKVTKFLHGCLPVQRTMHRRCQALTPLCCRCGEIEEDDEHVIKCVQSEKWRSDLYDTYINMAKQNQQDVEGMKWITSALEKWAVGENFDLTPVPTKYHPALLSQNRIGWLNWFKGRVSSEFSAIFPKKEKKKEFLLLVLNKTLDQWCVLWQLRNEVVHGTNATARTTEKRNRIHAELDRIYSRRRLYLHKDQEVLLDSVEEHKALPLSSIQNWMLLYKNHLSESAKTAKKMALQGVRRISNYFTFT